MTKNPIIYVFGGFSGSGKDTAASAVDAVNIKFASPGKRALEYMLRAPEGLLDDRVKRLEIAPHCQGRTYLQVCMDFYHHRDLVIGQDLFGQQTREDILWQLEAGRDVAITDMRSENEVAILIGLMGKGYKVLPFWIEGGTELSTDHNQKALINKLRHAAGLRQPWTIDNTQRKEAFPTIVRLMAEMAKKIAECPHLVKLVLY